MQVYYRDQLVGELRVPRESMARRAFRWVVSDIPDPGDIWEIYDTPSGPRSRQA
ncbi:hypothetical protein SAMN05660859_0056 [Ancylobacter rudongensis]|uniref:Uncharacterized protein n=1 Tax=Ancylobacter rudongensis TaxID=177413 RepID=A0A1G4UPJ2_9HYPH|nr:hypothetical protein SAMN05660859_0056 [Ancylobacter rudongensis]